ncbi:NADPH-dependent F420 reductase [Rhodococcus sp. NPDC057014]|uniref:NADPH-dependent F420 reductase n=1 Tax=Rhodococcus sp. NPDC057014 TaxID=3346000 RepID=UPI00363A95AA
MKIGVIGAGGLGTSLVRKLTQAGHTVQVANSRGPETLADLAAETGATAVSAAEAGNGVNVLIVSIPFGNMPSLKPVFDALPEDVIIADTSNYYPFRDGKIEAVENGQVESEWVQERIGRPVVRVWNTLIEATLVNKGLPVGSAGRLAIPVAGDDANAKKVITGLVDDTGFDSVDAGPIADSWRIQPGAPAYCTELTVEQLEEALQLADRETDPLRRELNLPILASWSDGSQIHGDEMVALSRAIARLPHRLGIGL